VFERGAICGKSIDGTETVDVHEQGIRS